MCWLTSLRNVGACTITVAKESARYPERSIDQQETSFSAWAVLTRLIVGVDKKLGHQSVRDGSWRKSVQDPKPVDLAVAS
jgi:hypothetical protein